MEEASWAGQATTPAPTAAPSRTPTRGKSLPLLTASRLAAYRRCPREEKLRYQDGLQTPQTEELRFGTLMHLALEAWWKSDPAERLAAALKRVEGEAADAFEQVRLDCLIIGYDARWGHLRFTVVSVEHEFRTPLINPDTGQPSKTWQLGGKMDVVVLDENGRRYVIEHKTASGDISPGSDYMARLRMDGQVSMYLHAEAEAVGMLYDVIRKVALEPYQATPIEARKYTQAKIDKKTGAVVEPSRLYANQREFPETPDEYRERVFAHVAERPEEYYQRATVVRLAEEMLEFDRELWQYGATMRDAARMGVAPRNPDACRRYGSMCSFWPLCTRMVDQSAYAKSDNLHPELSKEIAA
jgi:hypothetical protein